MNRASLDRAYRATLYRVRLPGAELTLRIGVRDAVSEKRLAQFAGCRRHWALVTPCNPHSRRLMDWQNRLRHAGMEAGLRASGLVYYPSLHDDPAGQWPDEAGFLLVDSPHGLARALGRQYGQNAIVAARLGEAPRLVYLGTAGT